MIRLLTAAVLFFILIAVIAHELPAHLAEMYGANETAVVEKIARLRFDWATYDPETCKVVYGVEDKK